MNIKVGISGRHIHLNEEDCNILFGDNYKITPTKDLSQSGEYACLEKLIIKGNNDNNQEVRVVGPIREYTQVEISKTDSYFIGVNPPIRNSGDMEGAEKLTITGPKGSINKECCIIATRHIHMKPEEASEYNLKDNQIVKIEIDGLKGGVINNVYIKTKPSYNMELHLDLDDANSHLLKQGDIVYLKEGNSDE
jgi:putative phosphotransacetylase